MSPGKVLPRRLPVIMIEKAIKNKLITITQEPEMRQLIGRGKGIQMPVYVNIFGDHAMEIIAAENGDIKLAMRHILSLLPEPKMLYLQSLAMIVMYEIEKVYTGAAKKLGISRELYYRQSSKYYQGMKRLNEEGFIKSNTDTGRLPP